ncbi:MAG: HAMP domain-containing histidine kinase [Pirellula sp.]|jgi:signal transduction histidine kinase|nr:HAMP domain-containing histidine kinase [Pirellula sp.]
MRLPNQAMKWWCGFAAISVLALLGLFLISTLVLKSEYAEAEARRVAALSENLRVALWRLDSALAPLIIQESLVAPEMFMGSPITTSRPKDTRESTSATNSNLEVMSELPIVDRFEWDPGTEQVRSVSTQWKSIDEELIVLIQKAIAINRRLATDTPKREGIGSNGLSHDQNVAPITNKALNAFNQDSRNERDFQQRQQNSQIGNYFAFENSSQQTERAVSLQPMIPIWNRDKLLLVRAIGDSNRSLVQGCQIDHVQLSRTIKSLVSDLFPEVEIVPLKSSLVEADSMMDDYARLASLPLRLEPIISSPISHLTSTRASTLYTLLIAWGAAILAILAGSLSLAAFQQINYRRSLFVSSVTHELRTPLTTFQLYTDLLTQGVVTEESQRKLYLDTLKAESLRLQHLVENILAFSRIERGRATPERTTILFGEILACIEGRIESAAMRGNMVMVWDCRDHANRLVTCNIDLMEQILLNLIDNSCKYAASAIDRRIILSSCIKNQHLHVSVRDFGPGFKNSFRWWRPFSKSAEQAAESAPGIGLGLALSKSLAKQFSAKLYSEPSEAGAKLTLRLELVDD